MVTTDHVRARSTDPDTSHEAARRVTLNIRATQQEVLSLFTRFGEMTDPELVETAKNLGSKQSESGLRTRRSELVDLGRLERKTKVYRNGAHRYLWGLV